MASPVSRLVEENRVDESVLSMVRCLYFVDTFVRDGKASIISSVHINLNLILSDIVPAVIESSLS